MPKQHGLREDLRASMADGAAFSLMVGMGETYLPAFALAMGMGEILSGLIASIPLLIGAILQLITPYAVARLKSNRQWVVVCVLLQASSFLPLCLLALWGPDPSRKLIVSGLVFLFASLYWGSGLGAGPAWNAWMETVVPFRVRTPFFAHRTRFGQAGILVGFIIGGLSLQFGKDFGKPLLAFAGIFFVASICRMLSARFLLGQSEPVANGQQQRQVPVLELLRRMFRGGGERMLLYFLLVQVAVQISGPYFTPYMLRQVRISYSDYMLLLATAFMGKIVALPALGRFACHFGSRRLLWLGGVGIVPIAGMWLYAQSFWSLICLQLVSGFVWAAYELAMFLLFFETLDRDERTSILTTFNLANAVALVIGSLGGGLLLLILGKCPEAYLTLFATSSALRAGALLGLFYACYKRREVPEDLAVREIVLLEATAG